MVTSGLVPFRNNESVFSLEMHTIASLMMSVSTVGWNWVVALGSKPLA